MARKHAVWRSCSECLKCRRLREEVLEVHACSVGFKALKHYGTRCHCRPVSIGEGARLMKSFTIVFRFWLLFI
ncbi:hypothetical protein Nepgr_008145 [Nepenthes gracilis]|uniref:Uncharacterized protein n=1 Tax=Nepenthes gracilis TaxID=150966 RepID=A0AAD3S880_NEPGR|nr:hypothetical protein Nepgr_008145 [Nepenthes gracilis]